MKVIAETNRHTFIVEINPEEYEYLLAICQDKWFEDFEKGIKKLNLPSFYFNSLWRAGKFANNAANNADVGTRYKAIFTYSANGRGYSNYFIPFETWIRTPEKVRNLTLARQIGRKGLKAIQAAIETYIQETENGKEILDKKVGSQDTSK